MVLIDKLQQWKAAHSNSTIKYNAHIKILSHQKKHKGT